MDLVALPLLVAALLAGVSLAGVYAASWGQLVEAIANRPGEELQ
jgi:hypothetical protein